MPTRCLTSARGACLLTCAKPGDPLPAATSYSLRARRRLPVHVRHVHSVQITGVSAVISERVQGDPLLLDERIREGRQNAIMGTARRRSERQRCLLLPARKQGASLVNVQAATTSCADREQLAADLPRPKRAEAPRAQRFDVTLRNMSAYGLATTISPLRLSENISGGLFTRRLHRLGQKKSVSVSNYSTT